MRRALFVRGDLDSVALAGAAELGEAPSATGRASRGTALIGMAAAMALGAMTLAPATHADLSPATLTAKVADAGTQAGSDVLSLLSAPIRAAHGLLTPDRTVPALPAVQVPTAEQVADVLARSRAAAEAQARQAEAQAVVARQAAERAEAARQQAAADEAARQQAAADEAARQQAAAAEAARQQAAAEQAAQEQAAAEQAAQEQAAQEQAAQQEAAARRSSSPAGGESNSAGPRVAAAAVPVAAAAGAVAAPATLGAASLTTAAEDQFIGLLNAERAKVGLPGLALDAGLLQAARAQSARIAAAGALSHQDLAPLLGPWHTAGENVGYGPSVPVVNDALVHSPGHYANMVNAAFGYVGVAVTQTGDGRIWVSEVFAG